MATRQYIGARYVPKFYTNSVDGSTQWEANVMYEPLIYVTLQNGHMYLSKKHVPATIGTPAENIEYWLDIGNYNGFIEQLQDEIDDITTDIETLENNADIMFFKNKKILVAGDSLSNETVNPDNWVTLLRQKLSAVNATVTNISFGGSSFAGTGGMYETLLQTDLSDYDILVIEEGTNDCTGQREIGSWSNTNDGSKFIGAMWLVFNYIASHNPDLDVYWVIPSKRALSNRDFPTPVPINVYRAAIMNMCNYFNWKVIDWNCGLQNLNPNNGNIKTNSMPDGLHISANFAPFVRDYMIEKLKSGGDTSIGTGVLDQQEYTSFDSSNVTGVVRFLYDCSGNVGIELQLTIANGTSGAQKLFELPADSSPVYHRPMLISDARNFYSLQYITDAWYLIPYGTVTGDTLICQDAMSLDKIKPRGTASL